MKRATVVVVMIAMLVAAPGSVSAQTVAEGSRVRVKTSDSKVVGTLTETTDEELALRLENGSLVRIPLTTIERLEVSRGKKGNAGKGLLIGLGAGVLLGWAGANTGCNEKGFLSSLDNIGCASGQAAGGFLVGLVGGVVAGALVKTERWKKVDSGPQITLTLPKRGIGAQVSVGW